MSVVAMNALGSIVDLQRINTYHHLNVAEKNVNLGVK